MHISASKKRFPAGQSASLKLAPGERKSGVTITIPRGIAFTGRVTDANGRPISGVAVEPAEAQGGRFGGGMRRVVNMMMRSRDDDLVRTGTDGGFTVRVKEGTYDVVFKREGFATKTLRGQSVSAASKPVEVKLDPGVEISGRVVRSGVGVEGVNVNAIAESDTGNAVTASDGSFTISDLSPGQMILSAVKPDAKLPTRLRGCSPTAIPALRRPCKRSASPALVSIPNLSTSWKTSPDTAWISAARAPSHSCIAMSNRRAPQRPS